MSSGGVQPQAMIALGFCPTCGAELAAGEAHTLDCPELTFLLEDAELQTLLAREQDAEEDLATATRRRAAARTFAILRSKRDRIQAERIEREETLRAQFQKRTRKTCDRCNRPFEIYCAACAWMAAEASP